MPIHNVVIAGHRTSVRLEPVMWEALREIAKRRGLSINKLVTDIAYIRNDLNMTAAIRVYLVDYYRSALFRAEAPARDGRERR